MRIATWNLAKPSRNRAEQQAKQMRHIDADIWVLTEVPADERLGPEFKLVATSEANTSLPSAMRWTAIASRNPAQRIETIGDPTRTACAIITPPQGKPIVVYGTVLPWGGSKWREFPATKSEAFCAAVDAQLADWLRLRQEFPSHQFCLAGDFNQDLNGSHYYGSAKGRSHLRAALEKAKLECLTGGEYDPVVAAGHCPRANIDHICLDHELAARWKRPAEAWCGLTHLGKPLSDHFGINIDVG